MIGSAATATTSIVPSPLLWLASLALLTLGSWSSVYVRRMWRDPDFVDRIRRYVAVFVGDTLSTSVAGLAPLGAIYLLLAGGMLVVSLAAESWSGIVRQALLGVSGVLALLVVLAMLLILSILLVGRPAFAIPPRLRGHDGLVGGALRLLRRDRRS